MTNVCGWFGDTVDIGVSSLHTWWARALPLLLSYVIAIALMVAVVCIAAPFFAVGLVVRAKRGQWRMTEEKESEVETFERALEAEE